ncbi:MAG TPA: amino acid permease [Gemmatimonadales bacterium]|jgi:APA family basic amino acid/polyamine antiporter
MNDPHGSVGYARRLGLFSATMMVIGGIIGSGIFLNPAVVAQRVKTPAMTLTAWGLGAVIALIGAFVFAELGQRRPAAGGGYAYLREAFGPLAGFLYAWALLLVMATGAIAAVAMTFASYLTALVGLPASSGPLIAAGAIALLTVINILGVRPGAWTQNIFTLLKLAAIAALIVAAFIAPTRPPHPAVASLPSGKLILALGAALVPVLFAFGGWQQTNFVAEELIEPERNLPRALVIGVVAVVVAYLLVNIAYLRALGVDGLAASNAPAADTMGLVSGSLGRRLIGAGIVASTFGFLNLVILVSPRVYQAMARDGLFFESFARLHPKWRTPVAALLLQGAWGIGLLMSKKYGELLDYVVFGDWIFFGLNAVALFVIRKHDGDRPVAMRTPLHPWSTLVFVACAVYVVVGSVVSNPGNGLRGTLLLSAGIPIFLFWRASGARER